VVKETELKSELDKIQWNKYIDWGSIKVQIRAGKPTIVTVEETIKLD